LVILFKLLAKHKAFPSKKISSELRLGKGFHFEAQEIPKRGLTTKETEANKNCQEKLSSSSFRARSCP